MKALHLPQPKLDIRINKISELYNGFSILKAQDYISSMLNEGLKQNLLGTDINMEFLILSLRSYSGLLYNMLTYRSNPKNN